MKMKNYWVKKKQKFRVCVSVYVRTLTVSLWVSGRGWLPSLGSTTLYLPTDMELSLISSAMHFVCPDGSSNRRHLPVVTRNPISTAATKKHPRPLPNPNPIVVSSNRSIDPGGGERKWEREAEERNIFLRFIYLFTSLDRFEGRIHPVQRLDDGGLLNFSPLYWLPHSI